MKKKGFDLPGQLTEAGFALDEVLPGYWGIPFTNKDISASTVVTVVENLVVFVVIMCPPQYYDGSPTEFYQGLLRLSNNIDSIKVAIDTRGDIILRSDAHTRIMDSKELKAQVAQIELAAEEVLSFIKPFLHAAATTAT